MSLGSLPTSLEAIASVTGPVMLVLILGMLFIMSPFSNVLNVFTAPLGYQWLSCPNCPDVSIKKITYTECAVCGRTITENFSRGLRPAGADEYYHFCTDECYGQFSPEEVCA